MRCSVEMHGSPTACRKLCALTSRRPVHFESISQQIRRRVVDWRYGILMVAQSFLDLGRRSPRQKQVLIQTRTLWG